MNKVRHVLGISGGKDSAALAVYLHNKYPQMEIEYYTCDTGKELDETYQLINNLEVYLGIKIRLLRAAEKSTEPPFDHFLQIYGGYLPSSNARWCTKKLKLDPFEQYVGSDLVISYVGIRGDEDRDGYISKKSNIQSIFPFRRNIWSEDVVSKYLANNNIERNIESIKNVNLGRLESRFRELLLRLVDPGFTIKHKLNSLLDLGIREFNHLVFDFLKTTDYPLSQESEYPLLDNDEVLVREDIFNLLESSGVGVPSYYNKAKFEVNGKTGQYSRSRSGCYFCFFQQKIEWVWLYEQHRDLFEKAMEYEKDGYTWNQGESLAELSRPERIEQIKKEFLKRQMNVKNKKSPYLLDILDESEGEGCASCFI